MKVYRNKLNTIVGIDTTNLSMVVDFEKAVDFAQRVLLNPKFGFLPERDTYLFNVMFQTKKKHGAEKDRVLYKDIISANRDEPEKFVGKLDCLFGNVETWCKYYEVPKESLVVYITLKPRDERKSARRIVNQLVDIGFRCYDDSDFRLKTIFYSNMLKMQCSRAVVDVDFESLDYRNLSNLKHILNILSITDENALWSIVQTKNGYHVYVDLNYLSNRTKKILFNNPSGCFDDVVGVKEVEVKTDSMIVLPGMLQGGIQVIEIPVSEVL